MFSVVLDRKTLSMSLSSRDSRVIFLKPLVISHLIDKSNLLVEKSLSLRVELDDFSMLVVLEL